MQVTNALERAHLRSNTGHSWRRCPLQEGCPEQGTRGEARVLAPRELLLRTPELVMICFDRYYKPLIRTKATSPISLPARQAVF